MTEKGLLVVDVQPAFVQDNLEMVDKVSSLIETFCADHLYFAKYQNHPGSLFEKQIDYQDCTMSSEARLCNMPGIRDDNVIMHFGYGLPQEWLNHFQKNYKTMSICGADTDACIMAMCFNLWDHQILPRIHRDYCWSSGGENLHQSALSMMIRQFGMDCIV